MFDSKKYIAALASLYFCFIPLSSAQMTKQQFNLVHQSAAIEIDGELTEAAWQQATHIPLIYRNEPVGDLTPPVKTDAYIFEDGESLYVAFIAHDPDPTKIRAALRDRDDLWADDNVALMIDTFNDERTGYEFYVNPFGAQGDMAMSDVNGWAEDASWNAIWDSAAKITTEGYVVEMRIPFSALRFPKGGAQQTWSIAVWRNYPREVLYQMANVGFDLDVACSLCQFDKLVGLSNIPETKNIQIVPSLTALRHDEKPILPSAWQAGEVDKELGVDLRWGFTQDAVINATINPDFSTVEADTIQLDINSNDSLYYDEKRPFFLDGASFFKTNHFNLLYTRNIAAPDYGVKLTGKSDNHSYGILLTDDENTNLIIPSNQGSSLANLDEKSKVAALSYQLDIGEQNNLAIMSTHRETQSYHNTVLSIGGGYWFNPSDSLQYQVSYSDTENSNELQQYFSLDKHQQGAAYKLELSRENRDYHLYGSLENVATDFRADLGYEPEVDYKNITLGGGQTWYGDNQDILTSWEYETEWDKTFAQNGDLLEEEYELIFLVKGQMRSYARLGLTHTDEFYFDDFFKQNSAYIQAGFYPSQNIKLTLFTEYGSEIDYHHARLGDSFTFEPDLTWDVNNHLQIVLSHKFNYLELDGERLFTANVTDLRLYYKFNMQSMLKLILQYENIDKDQQLYQREISEVNKDYGTQLVYSYKLNAQTLFYLGYSDTGYQDDDLKSLQRNQRTFFTKFSYAWQL
ncbi:carbohydrate binding family 9 domain-containing protein [Pseudoalteromonas tunicata]|uniref:carbohydrate binding family 9 domain-containing protein n=1 Tax=Pseudoalteromonas tunicata TaxID=314281 RepID=UPI00273FE666|nr:sugar-binding protein [Pseudoalteromonas tunicata]MDP4984262.1 carbohydrate binding family 9 domain-containing protein [Pseudoalteromonas tunicata]